MSSEYRWAPVTKDPEDVKPVALSLFALCANFWSPNEVYELGDFAWPRVVDENGEVSGIGYPFEATQAGRSGKVQPRWLTTADVAMPRLDGSVQWTCRNDPYAGLAAVSTPTYVVDSGLTISGLVVNENTKLFVDYAGGVDGQDYEAKFIFVIAGRQRIGRQIVQVRKK